MMHSAEAACDPLKKEQATATRHQTATVSAKWRPLFDHNNLRTFDDLINLQSAESYVKKGLPNWRKRDRITLTDATGKPHTFFRKSYHHPPVREQWRRMRAGVMAGGTSQLEVRAIQHLSDAGISVPEVVAHGSETCCGFEQRSFHILSEMPGESLESWADLHPLRATASTIEALATFIARFHDIGCIHRDLYLCHIFMQPRDDADVTFGLIDLARVIRPSWNRRRWLVKDLASLNFSTPASIAARTDRIRFLKTYLHHRGMGQSREWKSLARAIAAKTARIAKHDHNRRMRHA